MPALLAQHPNRVFIVALNHLVLSIDRVRSSYDYQRVAREDSHLKNHIVKVFGREKDL